MDDVAKIERDAIVAWLRKQATEAKEYAALSKRETYKLFFMQQANAFTRVTNAIERGWHIKETT
jgi:hypothetical protein